MYVCMYVYIYIYICTHNTYIHICICICICIHTYIHTYTHVKVRSDACSTPEPYCYENIGLNLCVSFHIHVKTHTYIYIHVHMYRSGATLVAQVNPVITRVVHGNTLTAAAVVENICEQYVTIIYVYTRTQYFNLYASFVRLCMVCIYVCVYVHIYVWNSSSAESVEQGMYTWKAACSLWRLNIYVCVYVYTNTSITVVHTCTRTNCSASSGARCRTWVSRCSRERQDMVWRAPKGRLLDRTYK